MAAFQIEVHCDETKYFISESDEGISDLKFIFLENWPNSKFYQKATDVL